MRFSIHWSHTYTDTSASRSARKALFVVYLIYLTLVTARQTYDRRRNKDTKIFKHQITKKKKNFEMK